MNIIGNKTPRSAVYKSESHKLCHAFNVNSGKTIRKGQMVVIEENGTISPFESGSKLDKVIGTAITDSITPAYQETKQHGPIEVTVAVIGYAIVWGVAGAASLKAGPVKPNGNLDSTDQYAKYVSLEADDTTYKGNIRAINLTEATSDGDPIQVLMV